MDTPPPELVSQRRASAPVGPGAKLAATLAILLALAGSFVVYANCRALGWTAGVSGGIAATALVVLPVLWHVLAEGARRSQGQGGLRLVLRCFAVNALLALSAAASLGPKDLWTRVRHAIPERIGRPEVAPSVPQPPPSRPVQAGEGLEAFIPADATWALRLSGSPALQSLLAGQGGPTQEKLEAMKKCHIQLDAAELVVAARQPGEIMSLIRAPGISDEGNLYCLVGALGSQGVLLHFDKGAERTQFAVEGLIPDARVTFTEVAPNTLLMVAPGWRELVEQRLTGMGASFKEGVLATPFARVDQKASLWAISLIQTPEGPRDLSLHAEVQAQGKHTQLLVHATAVPPAGSDHIAKLDLTLPLDFARGSPPGALWQAGHALWAAFAHAGDTGKVPETSVDAGAP